MRVPAPLRKKKPDGELYARLPQIEAKLCELIALTHNEIMTRCSVEDEADSTYIPSECLMYLVRENRDNTPGVYFEAIYKALLERVAQQLPSAEVTHVTDSEIRQETLGDFALLLAGDRLNYDERLDYYEIRFKSAIATLRSNAAREPIRIKHQSAVLEAHPDDPDGGEFSKEIEEAAGCMGADKFEKYFGNHDRAKLEEAISTLPQEQIAIIEMLRNDIPIDSQDPDVLTISKALGKAEKTIRLHRNQAIKKLTEILRKGDL